MSTRDLRRTTWGAREGAPDAVDAIVQASDGYLWLGSPAGLTRFDGLRFERVDIPRGERVSSRNVYSLFAPRGGGLWIGFTFGGVAFRKDGQLTTYAEDEGLPPGSVKAITEDLDGTVWAGTTTGLARFDGSRWHQVGEESGFSEPRGEALLVDSAGTLWVASKHALLALRRGQAKFEKIRQADGLFTIAATGPTLAAGLGLAEAPDGTVWAQSDKGTLALARNSATVTSPGPTNGFIVADSGGILWSSSASNRLVRYRPQGLDQTLASPAAPQLESDPGESGYNGGFNSPLLEDREGNVWVGAASGLSRFSERDVSPVQIVDRGRVDEFSAVAATFVAVDHGGVLVIGRTFGAKELRGGRVPQQQIEREDIGAVVTAVHGTDGTLWLGGTRGVCRNVARKEACVPLPVDSTQYDVQAMAQDRSGALWVSIVRNGVYRLADGRWTAYGGIAALPKLTAITLATDVSGRVWFGYTEGRVAMLDGQTVTVFDGDRRLPVGNVTALYAQRGRVWAGGEFGLAEIEGTGFRHLKPAPGTSFDSLTGIVETTAGDLWLNCADGIVHVAAAEVGRDPDLSSSVRGVTFGPSDGVEGGSGRLRPLPTGIEGSDGRLWFARSVGLYAIDPSRLHHNSVRPPVVINAVSVGETSYPPAPDLQLPVGTSSIRIDYVGLSLTAAEKVRYRYRLEGVDKDWLDVLGRRQAQYVNLKPGRHRFQVIAANNDGVWNGTGATLDFVIPPSFFQTAWFIALCAGAVVMLAWLATWLRVRQVASRMRTRFAERTAERERIARELHDTLLQSTHGLVLRFQAVANRIASDDPNRTMLDEALERADAVMEEGRNRVLDLRTAAEPAGELPEVFAAAGEELAQGRPIAFRINVEGVARDLVPFARAEIYRIGREALLNASRHSSAQSIEIQFIYAPDALRMRVRDDGIGVDPLVLEAGSRPDHWGLQGMRERAKRIGAQFELWSRPGAGTEIELKVPATIAYASKASRPRWSPFRARTERNR